MQHKLDELVGVQVHVRLEAVLAGENMCARGGVRVHAHRKFKQKSHKQKQIKTRRGVRKRRAKPANPVPSPIKPIISSMEWTADRDTLAALVARKQVLAVRGAALGAFTSTRAYLDGDTRARVDALETLQQVEASALEQDLARLGAHARYEFMFACMMHGALTDD
jgi:hypothetical protein